MLGSVVIRLDEVTYRALERLVPAARRERAEFIWRAVKEAIRREEFARMCEAYRAAPDRAWPDDDWTNWEEFEA